MENTAPETNVKKPFAITDVLNAFGSSSGGGDEEILKLASKYALQLNPFQMGTIMRLKMFAIDYGESNPKLQIKIATFLKEYLDLKHYHESGMFIQRIIADLSLKRIIPQDATKINVMKGQ